MPKLLAGLLITTLFVNVSQNVFADVDEQKGKPNSSEEADRYEDEPFIADDYTEETSNVVDLRLQAPSFAPLPSFFGGKEINPSEPDIPFNEGPLRRFEIIFLVSFPFMWLYTELILDQMSRSVRSEWWSVIEALDDPDAQIIREGYDLEINPFQQNVSQDVSEAYDRYASKIGNHDGVLQGYERTGKTQFPRFFWAYIMVSSAISSFGIALQDMFAVWDFKTGKQKVNEMNKHELNNDLELNISFVSGQPIVGIVFLSTRF